MATPAVSPTGTPASKSSRGKEQLNLPADRWAVLDAAVVEEMAATRVGAKFLKVVHVPKNVKTVPADVVITPTPPTNLPTGTIFDPALSVGETVTIMVQEPSIEFFLTSAQYEDEASEEMATSHGQGTSTHLSLLRKGGNRLAQVEDCLWMNGQNAFNHPLLAPPYALVQFRDQNVGQDLWNGLLNIQPTTPMKGTQAPSGPNMIMLPETQVIQVPPSLQTPPVSAPWYLDQSADAFAAAIPILNSNGYYGNYFAVVHQYIKADISRSLQGTFETALQPIEASITAGVYAGIVPPFVLPAAEGQYGLPTKFSDGNLINGTVRYVGAVGSLSGDSMDIARGILDTDSDGNPLDAVVAFVQKDAAENYRFRLSQRFVYRLKDPGAVVLLLFMDFVAAQLAFTGQPTNPDANAPMGPVTVQVQDANGHTVTSSTASVTIAIETGPAGGTLSPAASSSLTVPAVAGIATFTGLSFTMAGAYTLVATSSGLSSATPASFSVGT
jgi:hypothetical protein